MTRTRNHRLRRLRLRPSCKARPIEPAPNSRAVGGYDAYFGTYTVDDAAGTVTQRLEGALAAENVGLVLTRAVRVTGDELVIQLDTASVEGTPVVRTLRWTRAA